MWIRNKALLTCATAYAVCSAGVLWGQVKVTVSPANQPVDGTSVATMRAFSVLNASLADVVDSSASACVKSYAVYQACKADDGAGACGLAPSCSITANVPSLMLRGAAFHFSPGVEAASVVPFGITMSGNHEVKMIKGNSLPPAGQPLGTATGGSAAGLTVAVSTGRLPAVVLPDAKRVSGGVMQGLRTSYVQPVYPPLAKAAKMSGVVVMKAVISKDGSISALEIMSATNPVFNKAAIDAVRQWKYRPYTLNGEPTEVMTTITVNFAVNPPPSPPNGSMIQPDEHIPSLPH